MFAFLELWWAKRKVQKALKSFQQFDELTFSVKFRRKLSRIYPKWRENFEPSSYYDRLFVKGTRENNVLVSVINFLLLQTFGILFYETLAFKYAQRPDKTGIYTGVFIGLLSAVALYFRGIMKVLIIIAWRLFAGKTRTLLLFLILSLTIEHNLGNATDNLQGVFEGAACAQSKFAEIRQRMAHKMQDAMELMDSPMMRQAWQQITLGFRKIGEKVRDAHRSLQKFADSTSRMFQSLSDVTDQCNQFFTGPARKCMDVMHDAYESCHDWDPFNTGLCKGTRHLFKLCDVGSFLSDSFCRFPEKFKTWIIDGALGAVMKTAKLGLEKLSESKWYHWTVYVVDSVKSAPSMSIDFYFSRKTSVNKLKEVKKEIMDGLVGEIHFYVDFLGILQKALNILLLCQFTFYIILSIKSIIYYHCRNTSENCYITSELMEVDRVQKIDGQGTIFPLVGEEKKKYMSLFSRRTIIWEGTKRLAFLILTIIYGFLPLLFILLDWGVFLVCDLIYWTMLNTRYHIPGHYEFKPVVDSNVSASAALDSVAYSTITTSFFTGSTMSGADNWTTTISGIEDDDGSTTTAAASLSDKMTSSIRKFIEALMDVFSPVNDAISGKDAAWRDCFPQPNPPNYDLNWGIMLIWVTALILAYWQVWLMRQWLNWAGFFYPKRAHVRALHLYNEILEGRHKAPRALVKEQASIMVFAEAQLHERDSLVRKGLHRQGKTVGRCYKCSQKELHIRDKANCHLCPKCGTFYCGECYYFAGTCFKCTAILHIYNGYVMHFERDRDDLELESDSSTTRSSSTKDKEGTNNNN